MRYWWQREEEEEKEEEPHFLDTLVEEMKKPEEPHPLDDVIQGIEKEPEEELGILDEAITNIEAEEKEKKSYWWLDAWQKAQEGYAWLYPGGYGKSLVNNWGPVLETASYKIGDAATFLARLCPNQEGLPPWREQALPRQALTLAQGTSVVVLAGLIGYTGVSAIASLGKFLIYGRADKIAEKFATEHFDKIKALNPQVKSPEDAIALTQASLRSVIAPKAATTYLPTTMGELTKLGKILLQPLPEETATAQFKIAMVDQVKNMFSQVGIEATAKTLEPFTQTLDYYIGSPVSGVISPEYGAAVIDSINKYLPSMIDAVKETGRAYLPFDKPVVPEDKTVEEIEELVDTTMRKPLTPEEIKAEGEEANLLANEFTTRIEAERTAELFPEEAIAPTKQMAMYSQELKKTPGRWYYRERGREGSPKDSRLKIQTQRNNSPDKAAEVGVW